MYKALPDVLPYGAQDQNPAGSRDMMTSFAASRPDHMALFLAARPLIREIFPSEKLTPVEVWNIDEGDLIDVEVETTTEKHFVSVLRTPSGNVVLDGVESESLRERAEEEFNFGFNGGHS